MAEFKFEWHKEADDLLRRRGSYTLEQIHSEFEDSPLKNAVELDPLNNFYVTPVASGRYSVVWQLIQDKNIAQVSAVVPTRFSGEANSQDLKESVKSVVSQEFGGRITLAI